MNYGAETVFSDEQRLRNRIANLLEDVWFTGPQKIEGIKVNRQVDKVHLQYQDATTITQSREEAAETLFQILSAEADFDGSGTSQNEEYAPDEDDDFEDEDPDCGEDDGDNDFELDDDDFDGDDSADSDDNDVDFSEDGGA